MNPQVKMSGTCRYLSDIFWYLSDNVRCPALISNSVITAVMAAMAAILTLLVNDGSHWTLEHSEKSISSCVLWFAREKCLHRDNVLRLLHNPICLVAQIVYPSQLLLFMWRSFVFLRGQFWRIQRNWLRFVWSSCLMTGSLSWIC